MRLVSTQPIRQRLAFTFSTAPNVKSSSWKTMSSYRKSCRSKIDFQNFEVSSNTKDNLQKTAPKFFL